MFRTMTREKKRIGGILAVLTAVIIYTWVVFVSTNLVATVRHYLALIGFIPLLALFFKSVTKVTLATGVYLLIATFGGLAITPTIEMSWFKLGPVSTPHVQPLSLLLFFVYFFVNLDPLINLYLDYQEGRARNKQSGR